MDWVVWYSVVFVIGIKYAGRVDVVARVERSYVDAFTVYRKAEMSNMSAMKTIQVVDLHLADSRTPGRLVHWIAEPCDCFILEYAQRQIPVFAYPVHNDLSPVWITSRVWCLTYLLWIYHLIRQRLLLVA